MARINLPQKNIFINVIARETLRTYAKFASVVSTSTSYVCERSSNVKNYTEKAVNILAIALLPGDGIITPEVMSLIPDYATTPRESRIGYLNRLVNEGLLEKVDAPELERKQITVKGEWVVQMNVGGWKFSESAWSNSGVTLDEDTAKECLSMGVVPLVSDLLIK